MWKTHTCVMIYQQWNQRHHKMWHSVPFVSSVQDRRRWEDKPGNYDVEYNRTNRTEPSRTIEEGNTSNTSKQANKTTFGFEWVCHPLVFRFYRQVWSTCVTVTTNRTGTRTLYDRMVGYRQLSIQLNQTDTNRPTVAILPRSFIPFASNEAISLTTHALSLSLSLLLYSLSPIESGS